VKRSSLKFLSIGTLAALCAGLALAGEDIEFDPASDWSVSGRPMTPAERAKFESAATGFVAAVRSRDDKQFAKVASRLSLDDDGDLIFKGDVWGPSSGTLETVLGTGKVYAKIEAAVAEESTAGRPRPRGVMVTFIPERFRAEFDAASKSQNPFAMQDFWARGGKCKALACTFDDAGDGWRLSNGTCLKDVKAYVWRDPPACERLTPPPEDLPAVMRAKTTGELALAFARAVRVRDKEVLDALAGTYRKAPFDRDAKALRQALDAKTSNFFGRNEPMLAVAHEWNPDWDERACEETDREGYSWWGEPCLTRQADHDAFAGDADASDDRVVYILFVTARAAGRMRASPVSKLHALVGEPEERFGFAVKMWNDAYVEGRDYYLQAFERVDGVWRLRKKGLLNLEFLTLKPTVIDKADLRSSRVEGKPLSFDLGTQGK
jgi:hypothetical protein